MRRNSAAAALLVLLAAGSAPAQDPGTAAQDPPTTFEDLKNSLGELQQKNEKEDGEKRDAIVQKNQAETLKIYQETLGRRNGEVENVSRRLQINKALLAKYTKQLDTARAGLASTKAQYVNRAVALKKSLDEKKISKEAYDKLLEEDTKRFRNREKELIEDIAFYQEEIETAERLAKDLSVKQELMQFDPFEEEQPGDAPKAPRPGIAEKLRKTLAEAGGYRARSVVDTLR